MTTTKTVQKTARNLVILGVAALTLSACGSDKIDVSSNKSVSEAVDAATSPLEDLNLRKREIPEILKTAAINPYARPKAMRCSAVAEEVAKLDALLGADMQAKEVEVASADSGFLGISDVKVPTQEQVADGVGSLAKSTVVGTIRSHVNIIPFRSVVRTVTGANRYAKQVTEAYEAGKLRRAYLKGFAQERFGKRCLDQILAPKKEETKKDDDANTTAANMSFPSDRRRR